MTFGGAGGTLDEDRVEDWAFLARSVSGVHHAGWMAVSFGDTPASREVDRVADATKRQRGKKKAPTVFRPNPPRRCRGPEESVRDIIEWRAVSVYDGGNELDRVFIVAESCA